MTENEVSLVKISSFAHSCTQNLVFIFVTPLRYQQCWLDFYDSVLFIYHYHYNNYKTTYNWTTFWVFFNCAFSVIKLCFFSHHFCEKVATEQNLVIFKYCIYYKPHWWDARVELKDHHISLHNSNDSSECVLF